MLDFEVKRGARRCSATDKEFAPGDRYYSVLESEGPNVVRRDYAVAAWNGPPGDSIGWWQSQVPTDAKTKPSLAPTEVALELFDCWRDAADKKDAVYLLALFLVRKRVFRLLDPAFGNHQVDLGLLRVHCPSRAAEFEVPVVEIAPDRAREIQDEFISLLYSDAA